MSTKAREINNLLKKIANGNGKSDNRNLFFTAEVVKVDDVTCDVEVGGFTITGVHLAAVSDGNENNLIIKPKVGSVVLICDKTGGSFSWLNVVSFSEIASITMKVDEIVINEGKNDGLVVIGKMIKWMQDVHADLTALQTSLASIPVVGATPAGTAPVVANCIFSPGTTYPIQSNFENEKIKH